MTYLKYQQRDKDHYVNWAAITKEMTDFLNEEVADRETQRANIDKDSRKFQEKLSNVEQGEHAGINEFTLDYANNATQQSLLQDRLLKNGQLSLKDYNIARANLKQGTTELFSLSEKYQKVYKEMMGNPNLAQQSMYELSLVEGFTNFTKNRAFINPLTGNVSIGELTYEDGVGTLSGDSSDYTSVGSLNFALSSQITKWNDEQFTTSLGEWAKKYERVGGPTLTIDDIRNNPKYDDALKDFIESQLTDPTAIASILADYRGGKYGFTTDPKKQDEYTILLIDDPNQPSSGRRVASFDSEIGKKQREDAYNYLDGQAEMIFGRGISRHSDYDAKAEDKGNKKNKKIVSNLAMLYYGNSDEATSAANFLLPLQKDEDGNSIFKSIRRTGEGVFVTYKNGDKRDFLFGDMSQQEWVSSIASLLVGMDDIDDIYKTIKFDPNKVLNLDSTGEAVLDVVNYDVSRDKYLEGMFSDYTKLKNGMSEEKFIRDFEEPLLRIGFEISSGIPGWNRIDIRRARSDDDWVRLGNPKDTELFYTSIMNYLAEALPVKPDSPLQGLIKSGVIPTLTDIDGDGETQKNLSSTEFINEISSY